MKHTRDEVIDRTIREFERLDLIVDRLADADWHRALGRSESKDPWTVKDAVAHVTYWKANALRVLRGEPRPTEERGLSSTQANHLVFRRWHDVPPTDVLAWHRRVQDELLAALRDAPDEWYSGKDHGPDWPYDLDGHAARHRVRDIERVLAQ
jgi:hypothetical protein